MKLNYLDSPIGKTLFFKALPLFIGIFAHIAYNLADTFFVAQLGTKELAAMSFSFPVVMIVLNLMMGIATGINSIAARLLGEKRSEEAKEVNAQGILFTIFLSLVMTFFGWMSIHPLFTWLGVDASTMPSVRHYMDLWYAGMLFMNLNTVGSAIFRSKGNVTYPSMILLLGALINAILDPIFIFGLGPIPSLGIQGAALTTVLGNFLSFVFLFHKLVKDKELSVRHFLEIRLSIYKKILRIALPTSLASSVVPLSTAFTNRMLVFYGNAAVAANAIATRIETVPFIPMFALCSVLAPFIGQNFGARQFDRIEKSLKGSFLFSYLLGIISALVLILYKGPIVSLFDTSEQILAISSIYFALIPFTYGILGTVFVTTHAMNAIGKPFLGNLLSASRLLVLYLPLALVLKEPYGVSGVFYARVFANVLVGVLSTLLIYRTFFQSKAEKTCEESSSSEPR